MALPTPSHLNPSELGTKQYWNNTYSVDLSNHTHDPSNIGTAWFSDSSAEGKIIEYLISETLGLDLRATTFLDLGTGNGSMLFALREHGFDGRMVGVDYSSTAVMLARKVEQQKNAEVEFRQWDIMTDEPLTEWGESFDVVLDKGTFDAISLSGERDCKGKRIYEGYRGRVEGLVKKGGLLLVTSCNWMEEELRAWFEGGELVWEGRIKYPRFSFGGQTGQTISSVCFKRKS